MAEPCLLVLARDGDPALAELRSQAPGLVRQVGPADLSRRGWRYVAGVPAEACAVAEGEVITSAEIADVLCRIPVITAADLPGIQPVDREYAAAEMHAFLLAWLAHLRGPSFNAPTPGCLCGPGWHAIKWLQVAASCGLPVKRSRTLVNRAASLALDGAPCATAQVTLVGGRILGADNPVLAHYARRLAAACDLSILGVHFARDGAGWGFAGADPCPALGASESAALLRIVRARHGAQRWAA